jgi:hypothetical protein
VGRSTGLWAGRADKAFSSLDFQAERQQVTPESFLSSAPSMVVADGSGSWAGDLQSANFAPLLYYGGISKTCFRLDDNQWKEIPYFFVSEFSPSEEFPTVGVTIFAEDQVAGPASQSAELRRTSWGCFRASRGE